MRDAQGREHGIVRCVLPNGDIEVESFRHGQEHGLSISFRQDAVIVFLNNNGQEVARFAFDSRFREREDLVWRRKGTELNHLTPDHFNPAVKDPQPYQPPRALS